MKKYFSLFVKNHIVGTKNVEGVVYVPKMNKKIYLRNAKIKP
jgi:hypothetical protein